MRLRVSSYVHLTPLGEGRGWLILHAVTQLRLVVDAEVAGLLAFFRTWRVLPGDLDAYQSAAPREALIGALSTLYERGLLVEEDDAAEAERVAATLSEVHGRDPAEALDRLRLKAKDGADPYWSVATPSTLGEIAARNAAKVQILFFGECELQMQADFLRRAAQARGLDLLIAAGFPDDLRLAEERAHQAVVVGALRSRRLILRTLGLSCDEAVEAYLSEARGVIEGLRSRTSAPILLDNLPEPTVEPLGFADRGREGHRNRVRRLNLALADLAEAFDDVHVVDVAAALAAKGTERLVDDALVGFTHFGAPGWMLQRPSAERAAVFNLFPDLEPLSAALGGDPYERERLSSAAHLDALQIILGWDQKKCVIVDLDGTLWPGVLAETGAPFAWTPEVSGAFSYVGLYFGLHEALRALKDRGVVLACVSKNDEAVVRRLWTYPPDYPRERLLTMDDFVSVRINWRDKADNVADIVAELGFAEDAFLFIDDHPVERERVRTALPGVEVLGEDPFALRRRLLTHPGLQTPRLTAEAGRRTDLVRAQLDRTRLRAQTPDRAAFLSGLQVECAFQIPVEPGSFDRIAELLARTTQFNTTGLKLSSAEIARRAAAGEVFTATARDRFGDYGLVAAAVTEGAEIAGFVMSCRVIGLGVDARFLAYVLEQLALRHPAAYGRIHETDRNGPVRHLYADNGFTFEGGVWRRPITPAKAA